MGELDSPEFKERVQASLSERLQRRITDAANEARAEAERNWQTERDRELEAQRKQIVDLGAELAGKASGRVEYEIKRGYTTAPGVGKSLFLRRTINIMKMVPLGGWKIASWNNYHDDDVGTPVGHSDYLCLLADGSFVIEPKIGPGPYDPDGYKRVFNNDTLPWRVSNHAGYGSFSYEGIVKGLADFAAEHGLVDVA